MFTKKHVFLMLAIIVVAALAVACGGGGSTGGGGAQNVTVTMTDFKFDPATINATVGQTVNITITNKGQTRHTWVAKDLEVGS